MLSVAQLYQSVKQVGVVWALPSSTDSNMGEDDIIRCDLEGYAADYIEEVLSTFLEDAPAHGRRVAEIRMRRVMFDRLAIEQGARGAFFKGVPVVITDTGFDGTIEAQFVPLH